MPRFLIVEPRSSGHLLVYVRVLAQYARNQGNSVRIAVSPEAFSSDEMKQHLSEMAGDTIVADARTLLSPRGIELLSVQESADFVIVPHADEVAPGFAVRLGYRGAGRARLLIMRDPRWERPAPMRRRLRNGLKRALLIIASRLSRVDLIWLRQPNYLPVARELFAIDPFIADGTWSDIRSEGERLRRKLALDHDVFWFGMTGAITDRKNLPIVLEALGVLAGKRLTQRIGFAVVGPIVSPEGHTEASIRAACERIGIECRVDDRLLSNFEMNGVVDVLDAIVMAYSSYSPNSTLGKSWVLGARLVAAGPPSVQGFVRSLGAGLVSELDANAIAFNMERAMHLERPVSRHGEVTVDEFAAAVLGIDPTADGVSTRVSNGS